MKKNLNEEEKCLENLLKNSLPVFAYNSLAWNLGISKKMLTLLLRKPGNFKLYHLIKMMDLTGKTFQDFKQFIK